MNQVRVVTTRIYEKRIAELLPLESGIELENAIAAGPEAHAVIPGTLGARKARWPRPGIGKRGGIRVIYYFTAELVFIPAYSKSEEDNLTDADKKEIRKLVEGFKRTN